MLSHRNDAEEDWLKEPCFTLTHGGVLLFDELCEFPAAVLDALRQPLEEAVVRVSRARGSVTLPAPISAGRGHQSLPVRGGRRLPVPAGGPAAVPAPAVGPLLDLFDLRVVVSRPDAASVLAGPPGEPSATVATRVAAVRELARSRGVRCNAE